MNLHEYTAGEFKDIIDHKNLPLIRQWLEDGKTVAIYENRDLGHPEYGHKQFVTTGTPEAQFPETPPQTLPDFGYQINWRYQLVAVFGPSEEEF